MSKEVRDARWRAQIDALDLQSERFGRVEYTCTASDYEGHQLWERYHLYLGLRWQGHSMSTALEIGEVVIHGVAFPIMGNVDYAEVCGHLVAFVHSNGQVTDHTLLEDWRHVAFPNARANSDAWNFALLVHAMAKHDKVDNYFKRKTGALDQLDHAHDGGFVFTFEVLFPEMTVEERFTFCERKMQEWGERARAYEAVRKAGYEK